MDFGIVGTLDARDQHYLAENFLAFFERDYRRVAQLHVESGWVPPGTRVDELESAVRTVCEPIFNKPLKDISFGQVLLRLFETARRFNMRDPAAAHPAAEDAARRSKGSAASSIRSSTSGRPRSPILREWMRERHDPRTQIKRLIEAWPEISEDLSLLPRLLHRAIRRAEAREADERRAGASPPRARRPHALVSARARRLERTIVGASLLLAGVVWSGLSEPQWIGWVASAAGLVLLLALARARLVAKTSGARA